MTRGPVLVTGATGFIGARLVRSLALDGATVHVLARSGASLGKLDVEGDLTVWDGDIADSAAVTACFAGVRPSVVFHLAGHTAARRPDADREQAMGALRVNLHGLVNMLEGARAARGSVQRFVRLGGLAEYGSGPTPSREDQREQPASPYAASQVAATHWCHMAQAGLPFAIVTLRPALVFGPGQSTDFLIPASIMALLQGQRFATGAGDRTRDLVFVDDLVSAIRLAGAAPGIEGGVINVASGRSYVLRDVVSTIAQMLNACDLVDFESVQPYPVELAVVWGDGSKARDVLGWVASTSLRHGLERTIDWYRQRLATAMVE